MKVRYLKNVLFVITINFLVKPIYIFGIDRSVQNEVGPEAYGLYFVLLNFTFLFQIINDFGLQNFNSRIIAQDNSLVSSYLPNILMLKAFLASLFLVVSLSACYLFGYFPLHKDLLYWIITNHILVSFLFYIRSNIAGLGHYPIDSLLSVADRIIMILILGFFLLSAPETMTIRFFLQTQTLSLSIPILFGLAYVMSVVNFPKLNWDRHLMLEVIRKSWPFGLLIFLMTLYTRVDAVMLKELHPDADLEAGIYAAAYRLLDAVNMTGFLMAGLLIPMFASLMKDKQSILPLLRTSSIVGFSIAVPASVLIYAYRIEITSLLYHDATEYWGTVLGILMFSYIASMGTYLYGSLFSAHGDLRLLNYLACGAILLNVLLNFLWIPKYGALGAAYSTVTTQFMFMLALLIAASKTFSFSADYFLIAKIVGLGIVTGIATLVSRHLIPENWYVSGGLAGAVSGISILLVFHKELLKIFHLYFNRVK